MHFIFICMYTFTIHLAYATIYVWQQLLNVAYICNKLKWNKWIVRPFKTQCTMEMYNVYLKWRHTDHLNEWWIDWFFLMSLVFSYALSKQDGIVFWCHYVSSNFEWPLTLAIFCRLRWSFVLSSSLNTGN